MKTTPIVAVLIVLWSNAAQPAKESLPFALENFRWGMTSAEASVKYPALAPAIRAPAGSPTTNQVGNFIGPFHWRDCIFNVAFYFSEDRLDAVTFDTKAAPVSCPTEMQEELTAHFGEGARRDLIAPTKTKFGENEKWSGPATDAVYNDLSSGGIAEVTLSQHGGPSFIIYN